MNDKPTLQFTVKAGGQYSQGFTFSFKASGEKEIAIANDLAKALIDKIDKIKVVIGEENDYARD